MRDIVRPMILVLASCALFGTTSLAALAQQIPAPPAPAPVTLDPSTTAVIVLDMNQTICPRNPSCTDSMVPAVAPFLDRARAAGAMVVYSSAQGEPMMPEIAPREGETVVPTIGQDRFFDSAMDDLLRAHDVSTVVVLGWKVNGSVLYTSYAAGVRRYTVVVPVDGTAASTAAEQAVGWFQLLDQLGGNATNQPLVRGKVTLSQTDLISF